MCVCMSMCVCMYVCLCVSMCVCVSVPVCVCMHAAVTHNLQERTHRIHPLIAQVLGIWANPEPEQKVYL